ncbi:hypothetical protein FHX42_000438 [Saccharopolyspora lacisalsi]|uniref:Uncharacterized protein n=1 Tax=Halosaccharopolyspora lacisalsi TaxID=1000566 RepID=A0A839DQU2_9PSEU|nr:hypothetical protein [Halosaccharopolyspora lacisalsi]
MSLRVYTLSAISVTLSAVAGLWLGAIMASAQPRVETATPAISAVSQTELSTTPPRP